MRAEGGRAFIVASGLGWPRSWALSTASVIEGFDSGLDETRQRGAHGGGRALYCAERARVRLAATCEQLVERQLPDAAFVALMFEGSDVHVVSAGPVRAYLHRKGKPQRLTPREDATAGVLHSAISHCNLALEPGDLVMMGSVSAFSMRAISQVASVLEADPRTESSVIATVLTDPAGQAGVGAAAAVLRVQ